MLRSNKVISSEKATLSPITELDLALMMRDQGASVIESSGRYWFASPPGFYHAVHWLAKMSKEETHRPRSLCWGFQTTLRIDDQNFANGSIPLHIMSGIDNYDMGALNAKRRNQLRKCHKEVEIVEIISPDVLLEDGYDVFRSAHQRTGYGKLPNQQTFQKLVISLFNPKRGVILGGLVNGQLKGYLLCYAIKSTAYLKFFHLASDSLQTNIGTGLIYEMVQIAKRSGGIAEIVNSPHTPEKPSLSAHKTDMGFPLVNVPSFVWFAPMTEPVVKRLRPYAHYRLTGQMAGLNRCGTRCPDHGDGLAMKATTLS